MPKESFPKHRLPREARLARWSSPFSQFLFRTISFFSAKGGDRLTGVEYRASPSRRNLRFKRMSPEERVNLALELSSSITSITMESIRNQNPRLSTARLLEKARKRFQAGRRTH